MRHHGSVRDAGCRARGDPDHGFRDDHGLERAHAHRPDGGGIRHIGIPRATIKHRPQLRPWTQGDAPVHRSPVPLRPCVCELLSQRRIARPAFAHRISRDPRIARRADRRLGRARLAQHRGRLLRHDSRAHPGDCRSRCELLAAPTPGTPPCHAPERARTARHHARERLFDGGRTHEHHRLAEVFQTDPGRGF